MDQNTMAITTLHIDKTIRALKDNNITAIYVPTVAEVLPAVQALLGQGDTVAFGGSRSLYEAGVIEHLRSGCYNLLDRDDPALTKEQVHQVQRQAFLADVFLCSANALTQNGEIYNVDCVGNRVAAVMYGPKTVIMVVGVNKLVRDLDEAVRRVKTMAAPANAVRLRRDTYCAHKGECISYASGKNGMTCGCDSPGRICSHYTVLGRQQNPERITVILVGQPLGY